MEQDFFIAQAPQAPILFRQIHQMLPNGNFRVRVTTLGSDGLFYNHDHVYEPTVYLDEKTRNNGIAQQTEEVLKTLRQNLRPENLPKIIAAHKEQAKKMKEAQERAATNGPVEVSPDIAEAIDEVNN